MFAVPCVYAGNTRRSRGREGGYTYAPRTAQLRQPAPVAQVVWQRLRLVVHQFGGPREVSPRGSPLPCPTPAGTRGSW